MATGSGGQKKMIVVPLAPRALSYPHTYDPANEVFVQLDEPLWLPRAREREVAVEILSLCVQLDCILLSTSKAKENQHKEESARAKEEVGPAATDAMAEERRRKRVTFEKVLFSKVTAIVQQMQEQLVRASIQTDLQTYLHERGLLRLFPRLERYLQEPEAPVETNIASIMDGYLSHLTQLHSIHALAHQLRSSALSVQHHKYIAHITAVLYQCLSRHSQLASFRKEIEANFPALKSSCFTSPSGHPPKLPPQLKTWLLELCEKLADRTQSLTSDLFTSNGNVQEILHTVSCMPISS